MCGIIYRYVCPIDGKQTSISSQENQSTEVLNKIPQQISDQVKWDFVQIQIIQSLIQIYFTKKKNKFKVS